MNNTIPDRAHIPEQKRAIIDMNNAIDLPDEALELLMGCACVHPDAHMCYDIRYNRFSDFDFEEVCECYCHYGFDEDEEDYDE